MKAFEKIAAEVVKQAEKVPCSKAEFAEGLRDIRDAVQERLELAEDELKQWNKLEGQKDADDN